MSRQTIAAEAFLKLHEAGTFILPNPGDAVTARLLEQAGFKALGTSSAALAFAMGVPDGEVSRPTVLRHITEIAAATSLPVTADLGDGFGHDPKTVAETIRLAAEAGAVGGCIEDSSGDPVAPLIPLSLAVERIAAAVGAARALPFPFAITARAEHYLVGCPSLDDVLTRLTAYRQAGADVLYAPGLPDPDAVAVAVQVAGSSPLNVLAQGRGIASDLQGLAALGVRRISLGSGLARVAFTNLLAGIAELEGGRFDFLGDAVSHARMNALFGARPPRIGDG